MLPVNIETLLSLTCPSFLNDHSQGQTAMN
jgi:hypothetical protein